jgi:hypothetical protein
MTRRCIDPAAPASFVGDRIRLGFGEGRDEPRVGTEQVGDHGDLAIAGVVAAADADGGTASDSVRSRAVSGTMDSKTMAETPASISACAPSRMASACSGVLPFLR